MNENHPNPGPATGGSAVEYVEFTGQAITNPEELKKMDERIQRYDPISLRRIDHVRFFVGNARQSAYFYRNAFGFDVIAYAGLETRLRHEAGYVLRQGNITFVLVSPLGPEHPESHRLVQHGDGVMDIAMEVENVRAAYETAVSRGATPVRPPTVLQDAHGVYEYATILAYGDTTHTFVNRDRYQGVFAPGYEPIDPERYSPKTYHPAGLVAIDHIVANVEEGRMNDWVEFYKNVLGFSQLVSFDDKDISTEYSALMSKVMQNGTGRIKFPINEPARGKRRSQIEEYLQFYRGPGVQHIA
ncbi:MAG TPA: VOC family protein, partial [Gemmataceae bacterium]|nr:VOC family protein [Gemmataceae bacterium]